MCEISASKPDTRWWRRMESEYKSQKDLYFLFTLLTDFIGTTFYQKKSSPFENYSVDSNKNNEHFFWK